MYVHVHVYTDDTEVALCEEDAQREVWLMMTGIYM